VTRTVPARRVEVASIAAALLVLVTACQMDWRSFEYTRSKPARKDIVGSWSATDKTLRDLSSTSYAKARPMIVLGADGVVRMTDIPDAWRDFDIDWDSGTGKLETFNGRWELHQAQDWWTVSVQRTDWGCDNCIPILGQSSPYRLFIHVGDPDAGMGYEFHKVN